MEQTWKIRKTEMEEPAHSEDGKLQCVERWGVFEAACGGPSDGNPFTEQWIRGTFSGKNETVTVDGQPTTLKARGRHDPCVLPRAVPIVEAMAAMTILDQFLSNKTTTL